MLAPPAVASPEIDLARPANILIGGIGGTGIVTIGAIVGMAAHLDGRAASVMDQIGLAQKGGEVTSHIRIAQSMDTLGPVRFAPGEADTLDRLRHRDGVEPGRDCRCSQPMPSPSSTTTW